jgi:hypothetical protein
MNPSGRFGIRGKRFSARIAIQRFRRPWIFACMPEENNINEVHSV